MDPKKKGKTHPKPSAEVSDEVNLKMRKEKCSAKDEDRVNIVADSLMSIIGGSRDPNFASTAFSRLGVNDASGARAVIGFQLKTVIPNKLKPLVLKKFPSQTFKDDENKWKVMPSSQSRFKKTNVQPSKTQEPEYVPYVPSVYVSRDFGGSEQKGKSTSESSDAVDADYSSSSNSLELPSGECSKKLSKQRTDAESVDLASALASEAVSSKASVGIPSALLKDSDSKLDFDESSLSKNAVSKTTVLKDSTPNGRRMKKKKYPLILSEECIGSERQDLLEPDAVPEEDHAQKLFDSETKCTEMELDEKEEVSLYANYIINDTEEVGAGRDSIQSGVMEIQGSDGADEDLDEASPQVEDYPPKSEILEILSQIQWDFQDGILGDGGKSNFEENSFSRATVPEEREGSSDFPKSFGSHLEGNVPESPVMVSGEPLNQHSSLRVGNLYVEEKEEVSQDYFGGTNREEYCEDSNPSPESWGNEEEYPPTKEILEIFSALNIQADSNDSNPGGDVSLRSFGIINPSQDQDCLEFQNNSSEVTFGTNVALPASPYLDERSFDSIQSQVSDIISSWEEEEEELDTTLTSFQDFSLQD